MSDLARILPGIERDDRERESEPRELPAQLIRLSGDTHHRIGGVHQTYVLVSDCTEAIDACERALRYV